MSLLKRIESARPGGSGSGEDRLPVPTQQPGRDFVPPSGPGGVTPPPTATPRLMTQAPRWASGLPIAAGVWSGPRYCK